MPVVDLLLAINQILRTTNNAGTKLYLLVAIVARAVDSGQPLLSASA